MALLEELKDRADKLDAELLQLSARIKEIDRESAEIHACINAIDEIQMDREDDDADFFAEPINAEPEAQILREHVPLDAPVIEDATGEQFALIQGEPVQIVSEAPPELAGEPEPQLAAYEPLNQESSPAVTEAPVQHPDADFWSRALGLTPRMREDA